MNRYLYNISAILVFGATTLTVQAQTQPNDTTLNRVMVVEHEYTPEIIDAVKINIMPQVEAPEVVKKEVEYAISSQPATQIPSETMEPFIAEEVQTKPKTGFIKLGGGNYGNLDVLANYLFLISPKDKLDAFVQVNGMKGKLENALTDDEKWKSHYYRTRASLKYQHQFNQVDLNIAGNFGLSNFNYLPNNWANLQRFTSGDVHFGVKSTDSDMLLKFEIETNYMIYQRKKNLFNTGSMTESRIKTRANVWSEVIEGQDIGVQIAMNNMLYNGQGLHDYTMVDLNPYYQIFNDYWRVRVGANVDLSIGRGKTIRVSPDVTAEYVFADSYAAYIKATGGRIINDFRQLEIDNPYADITTQLPNTYEQINASVGIKGSPINGLWFNVFGGYQSLKDDLYNTYALVPPYNSVNNDFAEPVIFEATNTENAYGGATISYSYKQSINLSATGIYRHWTANDNEWALLFKPKFEMNFNADFIPFDKFLFNIGYQYSKRSKVGEANYNVNAINNLSLGLSYNFLQGLSFYGRINNMFSKTYQWYFGYPTEKFNILIGLSYKF